MANNTVYLVTGGNRGIGYGVVGDLLLREGTTVIATTRTPDRTLDLAMLPIGKGSKLIIETLAISPTSAADIESATKRLYNRLIANGITRIDTLIASAGVGKDFYSIKDTRLSSIVTHFHVNTIAPIALFRTFRPLLITAPSKFVVISSSLGSIADMEGAAPTTAYGISKAAVNYVVRKVHFEEPTITAFAIHPGWAKTGNGQNFADAIKVSSPPMTFKESAEGVLAQIDGATRETAGTFVSYDGEKLAW